LRRDDVSLCEPGFSIQEKPMRPSVLCLALLSSVLATAAHGDATEPTADLPGAADPSWLQRYEGSRIVGFEKIAYDEYVFPAGPLKPVADENARDAMNNRVFAFEPSSTIEGARTRLVYLLPAGRSPLEVLRGYEQVLAAQGAQKKFECAAAACGGDAGRASSGGGGDQSVSMTLWPESRITDENYSNASCAQTVGITDQRFGSFEIPGKAYILVHTYVALDDLYCKAFNQRVVAVVDVLELKAREDKMVTVTAAEMSNAIAQTGRVALYGILFDTASSTIKPESRPALEQIAALLREQPALKLHVVGHTDSQGGLESNFTLSRARAQAVSAALAKDFGIDAARLSANGVSYLAPVASNADEAGRAKNRRVELVPF
jgi:OmpA-OmpF porin, OOP family